LGTCPNLSFSVGQFYTLITRTGSFEGLRLFLGDDEQYAQGFLDRDRAFMTTNIVLESNFRLSDENVRQQRLANYPKCGIERDENRYVAMSGYLNCVYIVLNHVCFILARVLLFSKKNNARGGTDALD